jgi:hypothetical protein
VAIYADHFAHNWSGYVGAFQSPGGRSRVSRVSSPGHGTIDVIGVASLDTGHSAPLRSIGHLRVY